MRPCGSPKALETRRQRVVTLLEQDLSLHEIARRLGCHASSVLRWRNAWQAGGLDGLKAKPAARKPASCGSWRKGPWPTATGPSCGPRSGLLR
jgi:transposase